MKGTNKVVWSSGIWSNCLWHQFSVHSCIYIIYGIYGLCSHVSDANHLEESRWPTDPSRHKLCKRACGCSVSTCLASHDVPRLQRSATAQGPSLTCASKAPPRMQPNLCAGPTILDGDYKFWPLKNGKMMDKMTENHDNIWRNHWMTEWNGVPFLEKIQTISYLAHLSTTFQWYFASLWGRHRSSQWGTSSADLVRLRQIHWR